MANLDLGYIADVVRRAQEGDSNAFAELYAATCQKQYAFAAALLGNELTAQEALQQTYIRALKDITKLREPSMAVAWLNQLNLRECLRMRGDGEGGTVRISGADFGIRQIMGLPLSEAQAILLRYLCRMRGRRIASFLEMRPVEAKRCVDRGLSRLKRLEGGGVV